MFIKSGRFFTFESYKEEYLLLVNPVFILTCKICFSGLVFKKYIKKKNLRINRFPILFSYKKIYLFLYSPFFIYLLSYILKL